jgi:hypothetical protein
MAAYKQAINEALYGLTPYEEPLGATVRVSFADRRRGVWELEVSFDEAVALRARAKRL